MTRSLLSLLPLLFLACRSSAEAVDSTANELGTARAGEHVDIDAIVMGDGHMCALLKDSTVRCWGGSATEPFCDPCRCREGRGAGTWSSLSRSIPGLEGVVNLSAASAHTCAVIRDGSVRCWGGDESTLSTGANSPVKGIEGVTDVVELTTEFGRTCARLGTGEVRCWGTGVAPNAPNNFVPGWFGAESIASAPTRVVKPRPDLANNVQIVRNLTCIVAGDESVLCEELSLGCPGSSIDVPFPPRQFVALGGLRGARALAVGSPGGEFATDCDYHPRASCPATGVFCGSVGGALACTDRKSISTSTRLADVGASDATSSPIAMSATGDALCFVNAGTVACAGSKDENFLAPKPVDGVTDVVAVAMGRYESFNSCALRSDGGIVCWTTSASGRVSNIGAPMYLAPEHD